MSIASSGLAYAQEPGVASDASADGRDDAETQIVVTGTRIEGIAPVGSAVIELSSEDLTKSASGSTADFLRKVPQVMSFGGNEGRIGGAGIQGADVNTSFANSVNLRGLGTAATLNLINSHRVPAMGPNSDLLEPDVVPSLALQRIEIVADGASAIYGSDAVTGVVNYITRAPFDGLEVSGRVGFADQRMDWKAGAIASQAWSTGGIMVAYEHIYREALRAEDRPDLYDDDFSDYGGAPYSEFTLPGNIAGAGGALYGIPSGHSSDLRLADLLSSPNRRSRWYMLQALPEIESDAVAVKISQELVPGLEIYGDGTYYRRDFSIAIGSYTNTLSVPASNPYSPCNPSHAPATNPYGLSCAGNLSVLYDFKDDFGPEVRSGYESIINGTVGARFDLPADWSGDVYASFGRSQNHALSNSGVVATRLTQVLAGSSADAPAFNPFCDRAGCNSQATIDYIRSWNRTNYMLDRMDISGSLSGPLFALPGGDVRLAVGGEYLKDDFVSYNENTNSGTLTVSTARSPTREVKAVFGEIYVPLFGPDNATPGFEELDLSAAVRYEHYNDFGSTTNPKLGVTWVPVDGLRLHGSYGTSFHAPVQSSNNPNAQAGLLSNATVLTADLAATDFNGVNPSYRSTWVIGGNGGLQPETATTYSFGGDWEPAFVPGLRLSANYFNVRYTNKIDYPAYNAGATAAILSSYLQPYVYLNPTFFPDSATLTQPEWNALLGALMTGSEQPAGSPFDTVPRVILGPAPSPATTIAVIDARRNNTGVVTTDGLDLSANYEWEDSFARWTVGAVGTWVFNYKNSVAPGAPIEQQVNKFGAPLRLSARGEISAEIGNFSPSLFVNYQNAYGIARRYIPAAAPDEYLHIDANVTVDLSLTYRFGDEHGFAPVEDLTVTLGVQNLFDSRPPFVLNSSGSGIKYDNNLASPLGRVISVQVRKAF